MQDKIIVYSYSHQQDCFDAADIDEFFEINMRCAINGHDFSSYAPFAVLPFDEYVKLADLRDDILRNGGTNRDFIKNPVTRQIISKNITNKTWKGEKKWQKTI